MLLLAEPKSQPLANGRPTSAPRSDDHRPLNLGTDYVLVLFARFPVDHWRTRGALRPYSVKCYQRRGYRLPWYKRQNPQPAIWYWE
ncbi:hypothetical protein N7510_001190 [Penicillium lagena]|uniref:uncharacterized protein n=1 Tax=Penicillium lagena TaxID=94218 RepID=UPI00253F7ECD|nr:uncharacterized protein N7510_001190 [Penicillium lagena]KAJ5624881.1 hypothetical protein N7510_001190 [Penicillium lagena]